MASESVLALILGGGAGQRLYPLTKSRAKPAVPLGGKYRLIDIPVSNCINADVHRIFILTQYNSASLNRHIARTYRFSRFTNGFVEILAADFKGQPAAAVVAAREEPVQLAVAARRVGAHDHARNARELTPEIDGDLIARARALVLRFEKELQVAAIHAAAAEPAGSTAARPAGSGSWDNSNTQYGLLGVWSGAEVGIEVPGAYWAASQKHWATCQLPNGMWGYTNGNGTVSMTAAGTASLFVAEDYLYYARFGARVGREPFSPQLQLALNWWERGGFKTGGEGIRQGGGWWGYAMYGIERVGLAASVIAILASVAIWLTRALAL